MAETVPEPPAHAPDAVTQTLALLQPWIDYVPQQQRRLGIFIFIAVLIHLAAFVFIRIDETRAELRHQPRTHVTIEPPQAVNGQPVDDIWSRLTDPRLYILPLNPWAGVTAEAPPLSLDSNLGSGQLPEPVAPAGYRSASPVIAPIEQRVNETMTPPRQPFTYDETKPAMATKTTWVWDDALAQRQPAGFPDLPSPTSDTDLSPTQLRVAVGPSGAVEHVMVEDGSGDLGASIAKDLDQEAALAARKIRFKPSDQPGLTWGRVTVFWQYAAKPREEVVPTPPSGQ